MKKWKSRRSKKGILALFLSFCMVIGMACGVWAADTSDAARPSDAVTDTSISLEYWITNYEVYRTSGKQEHTKSISSTMDGIQSEEGVALESLAPQTAYSFFDGTVTVYYWQAMRLDSSHQQTNASGDDETGNGTTMTHIRYYNGAWQYQTLDGSWQYFHKEDQLVAYYLQKTDVTKEIETYAKDWGYGTDGTTPNTSSGKGQVALTVAVVYPDGTVSPTESAMYGQSTTIFNYWSGRDIGIVAPVNNSDYNIFRITVTDGKRTSGSANVWYKSDSIRWNKKTNEAGSRWYDETEVWNQTSGTQPMVNGKTSSITWSAKNTAKLILIYLEPIQKETNLNVRYVDDSDNSQIKSYQIAMAYQQGDPVPDFLTALQQTSDVHVGSITLDEDAYVVNSSSVKQTFNRDISVMTDIDGKYSSGLYQYMGADISEDGKTLTLHYNIDTSQLSKSYVIDFGNPVEIPLSELISNTEARISKVSADSAHKDQVTIGSDYEITYQPSEILKQTDVVKITVTYTGGSQDTFQIGFTPASNVMYEETVFALTADTDWNRTGTASDESQTREVLGQEGIHGYDAVYQSDKTFSGKSAYQASLSLNGGSFAKTKTAEFSFHGTGFDLISECGTDTGMLMAVVRDSAGKVVKSYLVDTYFSGSGSSLFDEKTGVLDYQVPVVRCMDLPQGTYQVTVSGCLTSGSGAAVSDGEAATYSAASVQMAEPEAIVAEVVKQLGLTDVSVEDVEISYMDEGSVLADGNPAVQQKQTVREKTVVVSDQSNEADIIAVQDTAEQVAVNVAKAIVTSDISEYVTTSETEATKLSEVTDVSETVTSIKATADSEIAKLTASTSASVYLDGVRIYNTLENDASYVASEQGISYGSVYDYVKNSLDTAKDWTEQAAVYVEYDGEQDAYSIEDYKEKGPQNEVYLTPGSQIAFVLQGYEQGDTVQIAAKAINDTVQVTGLTDTASIDTATELYYTVTPQYDAEKDLWYVLIGSQKDSKGLLSLSACKLSSDLTPEVNAAFAQYILDQRASGAGETTDASTDGSSEIGTGSSGGSIVAPGNDSDNGNASDSPAGDSTILPGQTGTFDHAYVDTIKNVFKNIWKKITGRWKI